MIHIPGSVPSFTACSSDDREHSGDALRTAQYLPPSSYDDSNLNPYARYFCAPSREELVERLEIVDRLYSFGALTEEVEKLGIRKEWLDKLHQEPLRVVIAEQPQPLSSLYSPLDDYGAPRELRDALSEMVGIRDLLANRLDQPVEIGFLVSRHHGVTFNGISFGGYFVLPHEGGAPVKVNLFTKEAKRTFEHVSYGDLRVSLKQVGVVREQLEKVEARARGAVTKAHTALQKQTEFNQSRVSAGMQVTEQQEERLQALLQQRATHRLEARSIGDLLNDWNEAVSEAQSHAPEEDSVSYIDLIAALNHRLAKRIVKDINFQTFANDTIDELPSTGVENWPKFVGSLMEGGLIAEGDSILRIRTVSPSGKIKFLNGRLRKVTDEQVLVGIMLSGDGSETLVDVEDLAAESRAAIARGDRPVITPCADMRIFFNLGFSRSIVLYDGAPYQRVMKSVTALREGRILDNPREPKLHSYSPLWQHNPGDMNDPWKGLCEKYSTVDYYALGVEDDESKVKLQWAQ